MLETRNQNEQTPIPDGLRSQLESFKKQLWKIKISEAFIAGCLGLIFSFLLVFGLDRIVETSTTVRLIILALGFSTFSLFAPYWIRRWVYGHRKENQIARLISKKYPKLGDRLLGVVELQDQQEEKNSLSPQLRAAAMRTVAAEASQINLNQALPPTLHKKGFLAVLTLLLISTAALITMPEAGINSLKRWFLPLSNTERFTFTQLDLSDIPTPYHVPYGESFSLTVPIHKNSHHSPETARARYGESDWVKATLKNDAYTFTFSGQRHRDKVQIEANDARHQLDVQPVIRPSVEKIRASITLPAYLERPHIDADLRSGYLSILEGSQMKIQATSNRSLSSAKGTLSFDTAENKTEKKIIPLKVNADKFTSDFIPMPNHAIDLSLEWKDIYQLAPDIPLKLQLKNSQDLAPSTYIQGLPRQHIMLEEETLQFEVSAEDDYGLKSCGIIWQGEFTKPSAKTPASGELTLAQGSSTRTTLKKTFSFSPANLEIIPQKIILKSWTQDYKPDRKRSFSEPYTIYILSKNEHAQVLKNEFDQAIGELEDIARKEQNLNDENQRLQRKKDAELQKEANLKKLQQQELAESKNKERLEKLTKKMEELFKNSVRNGEIDKSTLQKMNKALQSIRELAKEDLPKIEQKLQDSQSQRNTPEKTKKDLDQAVKEQKKALKKMKQALKDANQANKNFEANTFVNRLKRAANEEEGIASSLIDISVENTGSFYDELDPVEQREIQNSKIQQQQTAGDIRWIEEDLTHYYARTQKPKHKEISEAMKNSDIHESLDQLTNTIQSNITHGSIRQSKIWAKQLKEWAKQLQDSNKKDGGKGGEGGGSPSQEDQDFEFMIKVMRMIQTEQDIRARTRALEDLKRSLKLPKS